ncbi:hypothetical protein WMO24_14415 [Ruthenibacterium sp. CLA-JM-H11]|uniref:Uncharacterized protein n=1 Tax=Ruthenibacterium intestinale TaxID=3133163 RepID=A0ABV1GIP7_9FIRM
MTDPKKSCALLSEKESDQQKTTRLFGALFFAFLKKMNCIRMCIIKKIH